MQARAASYFSSVRAAPPKVWRFQSSLGGLAREGTFRGCLDLWFRPRLYAFDGGRSLEKLSRTAARTLRNAQKICAQGARPLRAWVLILLLGIGSLGDFRSRAPPSLAPCRDSRCLALRMTASGCLGYSAPRSGEVPVELKARRKPR
jgi:hypothetical protein